MKKNFVLLDGNPKFTFGGGQRVSLDILQSLEGSYNCYLVEIGKTPLFFSRAKSFVKGALRLDFPFSGSRLLEALSYPFFWIVGFIRLLVFLSHNKLRSADTVLYSSSKKSHLYLFFLKIFFRFPIIAHIHTVDSTHRFSTRILEKILRSFDQVWGTTPLQKNVYRKVALQIMPIASHEISNRPKSLPSESDGKIIVATLSSLIKIKGIEDFIRSYDYLSNPDRYEYWVLGDGPERSSLEQLSNGKVKFKGFQKNPLEVLKNDVHVLVFPTVVPEAFGLALLEAFCMGIPTITTNIGHQNLLSLEFQNESGVPIHSPAKIANDIEKRTKNEELYRQMSEKILSHAEPYRFENFSSKLKSQIALL